MEPLPEKSRVAIQAYVMDGGKISDIKKMVSLAMQRLKTKKQRYELDNFIFSEILPPKIRAPDRVVEKIRQIPLDLEAEYNRCRSNMRLYRGKQIPYRKFGSAERRIIQAAHETGWTDRQLVRIMHNMAAAWENNEHMIQHYTLETLFRKENLAKYYNTALLQEKTEPDPFAGALDLAKQLNRRQRK